MMVNLTLKGCLPTFVRRRSGAHLPISCMQECGAHSLTPVIPRLVRDLSSVQADFSLSEIPRQARVENKHRNTESLKCLYKLSVFLLFCVQLTFKTLPSFRNIVVYGFVIAIIWLFPGSATYNMSSMNAISLAFLTGVSNTI